MKKQLLKKMVATLNELQLKKVPIEITVVATDLAGNSETKSVTITVSQEAPVIENLQPSEDLTVEAGDEVEVSFESTTEGGEASFTVQLPGQNTPQSSAATVMEEVTPGFYKGTWTVPEAANRKRSNCRRINRRRW